MNKVSLPSFYSIIYIELFIVYNYFTIKITFKIKNNKVLEVHRIPYASRKGNYYLLLPLLLSLLPTQLKPRRVQFRFYLNGLQDTSEAADSIPLLHRKEFPEKSSMQVSME